MNRKTTTKWLSDLLIHDQLTGIGKYWASEVVVDWGTKYEKRIDYLQYVPEGAIYAGEIERGDFIVYEVKSCKEDVYSGNGLNFIGDENYIVTTAECYKSLLPDIQSGKLDGHIKAVNDAGFVRYGWMIAVPGNYRAPTRFDPQMSIMHEVMELDKPTSIDTKADWRFAKMPASKFEIHKKRTKGVTELLFCMVRSGK